uniref:Coiled-coil domain-containing protein 6 n=1 Tax=Rhabditophanes sp. KR3021 TaxID=114890 RepID=A0AC35TGY4_9BILA
MKLKQKVRYIAPLTWQDHFPLTESGLNEELGKQESLLEDLKNQTLNTAKMKNEEKKAREEEKKRVVSNIALKTLPKPLHSSSIESIMNEEEKKFEDEEKQLMTVNQVILEKNKSEMAAIASMLHQFNQNVGIKKIDSIDTTENIQDNCWIQECEEERKKRRILLLHIHSLQEQCTMLRASIERCNHEASSITQTKF